jgi:hypothetical protein
MIDLHNQENNISSIDDLSGFIKLLAEDFRQNAATWENIQIDDYLESVAAWLKDSKGLEKNTGIVVPKQPNWKFVATLLLAGKYYE